MKKEELTALGIADDVADKIFALHGRDIESHKTTINTLTTERDTFKTQAEEAGAAIESFKAMKPEELKAAADDYKAKFEQAQQDAAAQVAKVKFDYALENALKNDFKVRDVVAVRAHLKADVIQYDGEKFIGLKEQIDPLKTEKDFLFDDGKPQPRIIGGGGNQPPASDPVIASMRQAAGLK